MSQAKVFYHNYIADDVISPLSVKLLDCITCHKPNHVFEFGAGTGKHIKYFDNLRIPGCSFDLSFLNCAIAAHRHGLPFIVKGDDSHLRHFCNFDIVFTVSVMDHIEDISLVIEELKRICNKAVYLAETNNKANEYYYPHIYEDYGFKKLEYEWVSSFGDGCIYHIWEYLK